MCKKENNTIKGAGKLQKKTHECFVNEVALLVGNEYQVLSTYESSRKKVEIKHVDSNCGHQYSVRPTDFLNGSRCPKCRNQKKSTKEFKQEVERLTENEYTVVSNYKNRTTSVKIKHIACGHEYDAIPSDFVRGRRRCPKCREKSKAKAHSVFVNEVKEATDGEYKVMSKYKGAKEHIKIKHNHPDCGHQYDVRPCDFLRGRRCPKCRSSKGEKEIQTLLESWGYSFEEQVRFASCRNINTLPFDFGVKDDEGNIVFLIEYDGEQHFKEMNFFGGRKAFIQRVRNDRIKSNYAQMHGIPLFRVAYNQENKEELLKNVLSHFFENNMDYQNRTKNMQNMYHTNIA